MTYVVPENPSCVQINLRKNGLRAVNGYGLDKSSPLLRIHIDQLAFAVRSIPQSKSKNFVNGCLFACCR